MIGRVLLTFAGPPAETEPRARVDGLGLGSLSSSSAIQTHHGVQLGGVALLPEGFTE